MAATRARILGAVVAAGTALVLIFTTKESDIIPPIAVEDPKPAAPIADQPGVPASAGVAQPSGIETTADPGSPSRQGKPPVSIPTTARQPPVAPPISSVDAAALEADLGQVELLIRHYRDVLGENPVGTNAEIMKAVLGDNLRQAKFSVPEGQQLNDKGELVDRWGHPYFFHQVSRTRMEIRSAGPDGVMWTGDDKQM